MKPIIITKQIHSGASTASSDDEYVYVEGTINDFLITGDSITSEKFPFLNKETISKKSGDKFVGIVYLKADKTFQKKARQEGNYFHAEYEKTPEFKELIQSYVDKGWILEERTHPLIKDFYNREEHKTALRRKKAGFVLWQMYDDLKSSPINVYQGGFSDEVFNTEKMQKYVGSGFPFGYIGHQVRKPELDKAIEEGLRKRGASAELMYGWISSTDGRHFGDYLEGKSLKRQLAEIELRLNRMFNLALIYTCGEHKGTLNSSEKIEADYRAQNILLPEDNSPYDEGAHFEALTQLFSLMKK